MKITVNILAVVVFGLATCTVAYAQQLPPGAVMFNFAKANWAPQPGGAAGAERATILGDPTKPGPYIFVVKMPPNASGQAARPHTHPDTRSYTVLSGTWYIGFGDKYDESKLIELPAGSYYTEPAGLPHFVMTKSDGAVVMFSGTGPSGQVAVEAASSKK